MMNRISFIALALVTTLGANPVEKREQYPWSPYNPPCLSCLRSSWTQGPECTTNEYLQSTISRIQNPPASPTASIQPPAEWCSDYLRQTDLSTEWRTTALVNTYTAWKVAHYFVTVTDYAHPTSTLLCPSTSPSMECGWDSNTVAPLDQQEDYSIEHFQTPENCHQLCLERKACKAYRVDTRPAAYCEIFNLGLGKNATNVINPTPSGTQWYDRNCQDHVPAPCKTAAPTPSVTGTTTPTPTSFVVPTSILVPITPSLVPSSTPRPKLVKRDAAFPPYLEDLEYPWSSVYMIPACSCIISSALPPVATTTTKIATTWTSTSTVTSTYDDWFTITETPRQTTVYVSVN